MSLLFSSKSIGNIGEDAAVRYLRRRFYKILSRNYTDGQYEIDIIAQKSNEIIFIEVKSRTLTDDSLLRFGPPSHAVNMTKRNHIVSAARTYLALHYNKKTPRFDVMEIYLSQNKPGKILRIKHMKDAFRAY